MPELPEAEVICRQLRAQIRGKVIESLWIGRDDMVRVGLSGLPWYEGAEIQDVDRLGKSVILACVRQDEPRYIVVELGMTGLLLFQRESAPSQRHIHVVIRLADDIPVHLHYWNARRFGRMSLLTRFEFEEYRHRRFGVDPLTVSEEGFVSVIKGCRGSIKSLLLHQQKIAGIGNIYANEILFRSGIHPHALGSRLSLPRVKNLYHCTVELLGEAIEKGGSSIRDFQSPDGTTGFFQQWHRVYQKAGQPCPNGCGRMIRVSRKARSSFFCSRCQRR